LNLPSTARTLCVRDNFALAVCDFGLYITNDGPSRVSRVHPLSLSPEICYGMYTTASDVYSIAMVLFELAKRAIIGEYRDPLEG
jgi:serine/threonine protein kinase